MSLFLHYLKSNLIVLAHLRSSQIFVVISALTTLFFLSGDLTTEASGIVLFNTGNLTIPVSFFELMIPSYLFLTRVILLFVILGLSEIMLYGQLVHVILSRNQVRWPQITGFLGAVFLFLLLVNSLSLFGGLKLGIGIYSSVLAMLTESLGFFFIALSLILLLSIETTRKNALLFLIILLFLSPFAITFITQSVVIFSGGGFFLQVLSMLRDILTTFGTFSDISGDILFRSYFNAPEFWISLLYTAVLTVVIVVHFLRKDFVR